MVTVADVMVPAVRSLGRLVVLMLTVKVSSPSNVVSSSRGISTAIRFSPAGMVTEVTRV